MPISPRADLCKIKLRSKSPTSSAICILALTSQSAMPRQRIWRITPVTGTPGCFFCVDQLLLILLLKPRYGPFKSFKMQQDLLKALFYISVFRGVDIKDGPTIENLQIQVLKMEAHPSPMCCLAKKNASGEDRKVMYQYFSMIYAELCFSKKQTCSIFVFGG